MNFINPIEILDLQKYEISDIDNIIIKKAKRKVLAEIELSDDAHLSYKGHKINRSEIDNAINELDTKELVEFYHFIANNSELNYFLTTGNESIFLSFKQQSIYKLPNFINFISPYFAQNYDLALYKSFRENNETLFQKIITVKPLVKESDLENCYRKVLNTLRDNINEIDKITTTVKNVEINFDEDDIEDAFEITRDKLNVNIINHLPLQFQSIRNKCANSIRNLSVNIFNSYDDSDLALDIISYALEFNIDGLTEKNLQNDYDTINNIKIEREEQKVNAPVLKKYALFLIEAKGKLLNIENKELTPDYYDSWINLKIHISEINKLNSIFDEIKNQISLILSAMSISIWNNFGDINTSINLVNKALSVQGVDQEISKKNIDLKYKLLSFKNQIESNYATIPRTFNNPVQSDFTFSKKSNVNFKKNSFIYLFSTIAIILVIAGIASSPNNCNSEKTKNKTNTLVNNISSENNSQTNSNSTDKNVRTNKEDKYIGNQLRNGDSPFDNCFGKSKYGGPSFITFKNAYGSDAVVCLVDINTGKTIRNEYIRKGLNYKMNSIPTGTYYLKYISGNDWNPNLENFCGKKGNFQSDVYYSKSDNPSDYINVINTGRKYSYYEITLYSVANGNMKQEAMSESEFFK